MRKGTAQGFALLRRAEGIPVQPGAEYLLDGYYHLEDVHFGSTLHFGVWLVNGDSPLPGSGEAVIEALSAGWNRTCFTRAILNPLIPAGNGAWRRTFLRFTVPADLVKPQVVVVILARGGPFAAYWDDLSLRLKPPAAAQWDRPASPQQVRPAYGPDEVARLMRQKKPVELTSSRAAGQPALFCDGKPLPLFGFTGMVWQWPAHSPSHSDFAKAGVRLHWLPVCMGAKTQSLAFGKPLWLDDGRYDFTTLDERLCRLIGYDPDAQIMLYLDIDPYPEFGDQYPDAVWRTAEGKGVVNRDGVVQGPADARKPDQSWCISYAAPVFRRKGSEALRALATHLNRSDLGKAVAGIHITCGSDGQWYSYLWHQWDYSAGSTAAFREWLRRAYGNDTAALRKAWADPLVTFETATLPERKEERYFLTRARGNDRWIMDAARFHSEGTAETMNLFARSFKEAMGRPVLASVYYADFVHGHGINHCALQTIVNQPDLDGVVSVPEYGLFRALGRPGCLNSLAGSLRLHSKYYLIELDHRSDYSYLAEPLREDYGVPKGEEGLMHQVRRDLGMSLCQGGGAWVYGLGGNNWWSEKGVANLAEAYKAAREAALKPIPSDVGQMAVFCDEKIPAFMTGKDAYSFYTAVAGHYSARQALNLSGIPWDGYLLSDLDNAARPRYKINLFLSAVSLEAGQVDWIEKNLQKDGNVLVFLHAAGYGCGGGFARNIRRLTGMNVKEGLEQEYRFDSLNALWERARGPRFSVDDKTATTIALHASTGEPAVAVKRFPSWISVYIALPGGFTPTMLRAIAGLAGVVPVGPEGDATYAGNGFLVIHARTAGEKTLRWTGKSDIIDISTGMLVARSAEQYSLRMEALTTKWFRRIPVQ